MIETKIERVTPAMLREAVKANGFELIECDWVKTKFVEQEDRTVKSFPCGGCALTHIAVHCGYDFNHISGSGIKPFLFEKGLSRDYVEGFIGAYDGDITTHMRIEYVSEEVVQKIRQHNMGVEDGLACRNEVYLPMIKREEQIRRIRSLIEDIKNTDKLIDCFYQNDANCYCVIGLMGSKLNIIDRLTLRNGTGISAFNEDVLNVFYDQYGLDTYQLWDLQRVNDAATDEGRKDDVINHLEKYIEEMESDLLA